MIIEFWYDSDSLPIVAEFDAANVNSWIAKTTAQTNRLIELTNLLSSISNFQFFFIANLKHIGAFQFQRKKLKK